MPDGSKWEVPARVIAEDRAKYYASQEDAETTYEQEFESTMKDHDELIDWAANNMNWEAVVAKASRAVPPPIVNYQEGWCNGEKEIIER